MQALTGFSAVLEGCRVLDLADERGAYGGRVLADFGADVIAIEPPEGNPARRRGPFRADQPGLENSLFWFFTAANKRGITLNLADQSGREFFLRLVDGADVVIESAAPGRLAAIGLGRDALLRRKPSLVVTSITPFGQTGPYSQYAEDDLILVAMGGLMRLYGYLDGSPFRITAPQAHLLGGLHGAMASTLAYYHAEVTGQGQLVDVSIQEAVALSLLNAAEVWDLLRVNLRGAGSNQVLPRPAPQRPLYARRMFPVKDGFVWLLAGGGSQAGLVASTRKVVEFANADGYALELAEYDWGIQDASTVTQEIVDQQLDAFAGWLLTKTKAELYALAVAHGLLLAPVHTAGDAAADPQLGARGFWRSVEHAELGQAFSYPGAPLRVDGVPLPLRRRAPLLGEHNEEVYCGELGLPRAEFSRLRSAGVI